MAKARTPSTDEQDRAIKWIRDQKALADEHRASYVARWDKYEKLYASYSDTPSWWDTDDSKWRSRVFVPLAFTIVETIVPRLTQGLFASEPFWRNVPLDRQSEDATDAAQEYLQFVIYQTMDFFEQFAKGLKYAPKLGTSFFKVFSYPETTYEWDYTRGVLGFRKGRKRKVTTEMRTAMKSVSPYDIWFHPLAKDINGPDGATAIIEEIRLSKRVFNSFNNVPGYFNIPKLRDTSFPESSYPASNPDEDGSYTYKGHSPPGPQAFHDHVLVEEFHGDYDLRENGEMVPVRMRVANDTALISIDEIEPRAPYFRIRYGLNENDIYGDSAIRPMEELNETVNTFVRQRLDNSAMLNWGMFKKRKGADIGDTTVKPGKFFELTRMGDLEQLVITDHTGGIMNDVGFLMGIIDRVTGVNDYLRGQGSPGSQTAFEVGTLVQESHARFNMALMMIRQEGLSEALDLIWDESIRHLSPQFDLRILKENEVHFKKQSISNIIGTFAWRIQIPPYQGNRMLVAQRLQSAIGVLAQIPKFQNKIDGVIKHLLEALEVPNVDDIMEDPKQKFEIQGSASSAIVENEIVAIGEDLDEPAPEENHQIHLRIHANAPPEIQQKMADHVALHQIYLQQDQSPQSQVAAQESPAPERMPEESEQIRRDSIRESPGTAPPAGGTS